MIYIIDRTDLSKIPIEVEPAGKKRQAGITWKGKYFSPWGEDLNENILKLTENFASPNEPGFYDDSDAPFNILEGQLWFHTNDAHNLGGKILKIQNLNSDNNTNGWKRLELIVANSKPTFHTLGEQWYDTRDKTISISRGNGVFDNLTVKKALDSDLLDGLDSEQFLRSDVDDTMYGTLRLSNTLPRSNDFYDFGTSSIRWKNLFSRNLVTDTSHSILPEDDDTYILGNNSKRWKEIDSVLLDTRFSRHMIPVETTTYNLGTSSNRWNNAHIKTLYNEFSSDLKPISNQGHSLGSNSYRWNELYVATIDSNFYTDLIPLTNNNYVIGNSSNRWKSIDVEIIRNTTSENINPITNNFYDLGTSSLRYRRMFLNNIGGDLRLEGDTRFDIPNTNGDSKSLIYSNSSTTLNIFGKRTSTNTSLIFNTSSNNSLDGYIFNSNDGNEILLVRQNNILVKETDLVVKTNLKLESPTTNKGFNMAYNDSTESIEFIFYE